MLVVSDSSPLNFLVRMGQVQLLPQLFERVIIPPEVVAELSTDRTPPDVRTFIAAPPGWMQIVAAQHADSSGTSLGPGETAAMRLALQVHAFALLADDRNARRAARSLGLRIIGLLGVLELADIKGLVVLADVIPHLPPDYRINLRLLKDALEASARRRGQKDV
jgi:predicted nucleic acid-binding protein